MKSNKVGDEVKQSLSGFFRSEMKRHKVNYDKALNKSKK